MARACLVLLALGATLGTALDAWHVVSGTTRYAHVWAWGIATWTIPLFAFAGFAVGALPVAGERALGIAIPAPPPGRVIGAVALFVLAYLVTGIVRGTACALALTVLATAIWVVSGRPPLRVALAHALGAAVGGALTEMTLVHFGTFFHTDDRFFGVAPWLPLLYVGASLGLTPLARSFFIPSAAAASSAG